MSSGSRPPSTIAPTLSDRHMEKTLGLRQWAVASELDRRPIAPIARREGGCIEVCAYDGYDGGRCCGTRAWRSGVRQAFAMVG